jgi:hypothetical protein
MLIAQIATYKNQRVRELTGIQTRLGYSIYSYTHVFTHDNDTNLDVHMFKLEEYITVL